jgi:hypothetical protein
MSVAGRKTLVDVDIRRLPRKLNSDGSVPAGIGCSASDGRDGIM